MSESNDVLVSVIMPAYNAELYIAKSIESALNQTVKELEVVIVDDGSEDDSMTIAESFGERVRIYRQENKGPAAARNNAVRQAKGEWIAFLDSDDLWATNKIEKQLTDCHDQIWSHTNYVFIGSEHDGTIRSSDRAPQYGGDVLSELVVNNFIGTSTVMMRKDIFMELGGFDESLRALQDWDLWLKVAAKHELAYLSEPLGEYRVHASSTSRSARKTLPIHVKVIERTFANGGVGESMPDLRHAALASSFGVCSIIAEESNDLWFALKCAVRSLCHEPKSLWRWKSVIRIILTGLPGPYPGK